MECAHLLEAAERMVMIVVLLLLKDLIFLKFCCCYWNIWWSILWSLVAGTEPRFSHINFMFCSISKKYESSMGSTGATRFCQRQTAYHWLFSLKRGWGTIGGILELKPGSWAYIRENTVSPQSQHICAHHQTCCQYAKFNPFNTIIIRVSLFVHVVYS